MISELQSSSEGTPIDRLLREQGRLQTPVADFSRRYDAGDVSGPFRELIPLENPKADEQFAFEVDLDRCTGCKACVAGCHSLNGLEENETWRDVGLIQGLVEGEAYQQTVTTACHHCADPGCLNGCPVNAYEKDSVTGIVLHLDDQCIGCQYCVLKCPYDVPKYSKRLGIVRKCDMCYSRLSVGEAPACVQSCPTEAIRIVTVNKDAVQRKAEEANTPAFLPASPHQSFTKPTTAYVSVKHIPQNAVAGDATVLRPQHAHWPLVIMLSLTQISVGLTIAAALWPAHQRFLLLVSSVICMMGLGASALHLGQPLKAWRAFLGIMHSWLSREIVTFGGYAPILIGLTAAQFISLPIELPTAAVWLPVLIGLAGVFTSVMIYADTPRPFWRFQLTASRFFGSTMIALGAGGCVFGVGLSAILLLGLGLIAKVAVDVVGMIEIFNADFSPDKHSALIQMKCERKVFISRWLLTVAGTVMVALSPLSAFAIGGALLLIGGEVSERYLFFRAVAAPKMPGGIRP
ncbi:DmsC/YnfH family molybdoenzyme membrane anchor subunit [Cerasicoccus arenae]|uniref:Molybdopterin oxidoreductase n=1 Tax=Cerasicoccus arenae TaxID=424488 RepID=A0A8J3GDF2_9BACT|nr:DmsC/YnfH family molybdoenzyme membrane anchor subunit [Cerasicoccus arenae]MBK1859719.1 dimethyl sulfoxide reductase anchor subunit [Cerasicoccus arenae]GHC05962.1 molybdopterin oxidoreductase [Cerasicoccus arenae]